ncbi:MAG: hypothetical protein ACI90U_002723 [Pseudomonadales bacterium]|jgi:hypothetical protein
MIIKKTIIFTLAFSFCSAGWAQQSIDLVLQGGRVIDPETGFMLLLTLASALVI